jgi:hypothetical protein
MKKIFVIFSLATALVFASCATQKENVGTYGVSATSAQTMRPDTLDNAKVDSLLKADSLPAIKKWTTSSFVDEETHVTSTYRTLYDQTTNTIYTLKTLADGRFVLIKRVIRTR